MRSRLGGGAAAVFLILAWLFGASRARAAGSANAQFSVTATVLEDCTVSASDLVFGDYSAISGSPTDASSTLSITCTSGLGYTVALDGGTTTGDVAARAMQDGSGHQLAYGLYTSNTHGTLWGDGNSGTATPGGTGTGSAQPVTIYGRIPASQIVGAGDYTDHVTVTVNY